MRLHYELFPVIHKMFGRYHDRTPINLREAKKLFTFYKSLKKHDYPNYIYRGMYFNKDKDIDRSLLNAKNNYISCSKDIKACMNFLSNYEYDYFHIYRIHKKVYKDLVLFDSETLWNSLDKDKLFIDSLNYCKNIEPMQGNPASLSKFYLSSDLLLSLKFMEEENEIIIGNLKDSWFNIVKSPRKLLKENSSHSLMEKDVKFFDVIPL